MIDDFDPALSPAAALALAVERIGSQTLMGQLLGITQGAVSKRLRRGQPCWAEATLLVEAKTGVSKHNLRPDLYPPARDPLGQPPAAEPSLSAGGSISVPGAPSSPSGSARTGSALAGVRS